MNKHRADITGWELEAARRREVIAADFGAARRARPTLGLVGTTSGPTAWIGGWASAIGRRIKSDDAATDESMPCTHAVVR